MLCVLLCVFSVCSIQLHSCHISINWVELSYCTFNHVVYTYIEVHASGRSMIYIKGTAVYSEIWKAGAWTGFVGGDSELPSSPAWSSQFLLLRLQRWLRHQMQLHYVQHQVRATLLSFGCLNLIQVHLTCLYLLFFVCFSLFTLYNFVQPLAITFNKRWFFIFITIYYENRMKKAWTNK